MKKITALLIIASSIFVLQIANAEPTTTTTQNKEQPKVKKETIVVEGKLGTIKEDRVKSVQSKITFVPAGKATGYDLIDISDTGADGISEHIESEEISIPSWTLFSW